MEIWKSVIGYEGLYEVSNLGHVRRIKRGKLFTADMIDTAKNMIIQKSTLKEVADFLNTSITTVMSIKHGKTWNGESNSRPCKAYFLKGYCQICLCKNGIPKKVALHRVIWEAFNGPIEGRNEINHKDLNRSNNSLDNLEVVPHQQNIQHAIDAYKDRGLLRAVKGKKGFIAGKHSGYENK